MGFADLAKWLLPAKDCFFILNKIQYLEIFTGWQLFLFEFSNLLSALVMIEL
ncbi:hypothetical protein SRA_08016 [Streptococcus ratti FA-1 = DSM 20564]|uniref:Uncharacterized protein n=1 Tax=Streptococcus ratti FA-1 = DSM 20564 TaxID=699248 RepID=A0ABP2QZY8_STRRT|nr:hypothetical protein SRA_08016 [Streptococcus ratti FA-1 = DSM 20564]